MEIRIQFETKNDLSGYEGIARVNNLSCGVGSADSFKWECDLEWARGKDNPVKQLSIFQMEPLLAECQSGGTLGNFIEM